MVVNILVLSEVHVRLEGESNVFWTLRFTDGTVHKYWSCDHGGIDVEDDNTPDADDSLEDKMWELHDKCTPYLTNGDEIMEFDFCKMMFKPTRIVHIIKE